MAGHGNGRLHRAVVAAARVWALAGGAVLLGIVGLTGTSVVLDMLLGAPVPGDFELVQLGCAVAAFAFLPWCQVRRGHVAVDVFTARARPAVQAALAAAGSLLLLLLALLLLWRMSLGALAYYDPHFPETTAILGVPVWTVFPPILVSLLLWVAAACVTLREDLAAWRATE